MANEALRELKLAVDNFKEVVDRLTEIKGISENAKISADTIQQVHKELTEYTSELVKTADKVGTLCAQILEGNKQTSQFVSDKLRDTQKAIVESNSEAQKAIVESNESAIDLITKCNDTVIEKVLGSNDKTVKNIAEYVEAVRGQVTEYTLSVQKSIDEIRMQNTNNARELRDNISYAKADLAVKLDGIQTSVNSLLAKNKSDHIFIMLGAISAVVAAIASIVGLFI